MPDEEATFAKSAEEEEEEFHPLADEEEKRLIYSTLSSFRCVILE